MSQNIIKGMTAKQLDHFLKDKSVRRDLYKFTAKEIFEHSDEEGCLTKETFLKLYASWTDAEKEQIENILTLIRNDVHIGDLTDFKKGKKEEYCELYVESETLKHIFRVYAPLEFCAIIIPSFIEGTFDKPAFTLKELYLEATNSVDQI